MEADMARNSIAGAWIAGLAIWAGALGMLSTFVDGPQQAAMASPERPAVEQTLREDAFDRSDGEDYWLEARDAPQMQWPNAGMPGM
jgi:hypothetical protein